QILPRTLGGQSAERWIPVNAASRRRRWPKASVYRDRSPAKIGRRDRWRCSIACSPTQNIQRSGRQARRISADSHRRQHRRAAAKIRPELNDSRYGGPQRSIVSEASSRYRTLADALDLDAAIYRAVRTLNGSPRNCLHRFRWKEGGPASDRFCGPPNRFDGLANRFSSPTNRFGSQA